MRRRDLVEGIIHVGPVAGEAQRDRPAQERVARDRRQRGRIVGALAQGRLGDRPERTASVVAVNRSTTDPLQIVQTQRGRKVSGVEREQRLPPKAVRA